METIILCCSYTLKYKFVQLLQKTTGHYTVNLKMHVISNSSPSYMLQINSHTYAQNDPSSII